MNCPHCLRSVVNIVRVSREFFVVEEDALKFVDISEGIGSDIQILCGHCFRELDLEGRGFFYQRYTAMLGLQRPTV